MAMEAPRVVMRQTKRCNSAARATTVATTAVMRAPRVMALMTPALMTTTQMMMTTTRKKRDGRGARGIGGAEDDDGGADAAGGAKQDSSDDDDDDFPTSITSPFPIKFHGEFQANKSPDRLLPLSILADGGLLLKSPYVSPQNHLCWARALEGVVIGDKEDLLALAEDMSSVLLNITEDEAGILKKPRSA